MSDSDADAAPAAAGDEEQTDIDPAEAERLLAAGAKKRKRRLLDLERETLPADTRHYAVKNLLDDKVEAVLDGRGLTSDGGPPGVIGEFLLGVENLVERLGGALRMRHLAFGNSVHVILEPEVPEPVRREVDKLAEEDPNGVITRDDLPRLIPPSVAAVSAAARILNAPAEAALREARRYGSDIPDAYLRVARTVEKTGGTVRVRAPGGREAALPAARAERVIAQAKAERPPERAVPIEVVGTLTRTDSEERRFRLVLDRELIPDVLDKRKRVIEGTYTPDASKQVRAGGLWDTRVIARVHAFPVEDPLTGKRHFERFIFRRIRPAT